MERCQKWTLRATHSAAHSPRILTVCNYEYFQAAKKRDSTAADAANDTAETQQSHSDHTQQKEGINHSNEGEGIESVSAAPSRALATLLPYSDAVEAWTQAATLKGWEPKRPQTPLSDKRRNLLGKVLKVHGLPGWVAGLQRAMESEWLGGPDPPPWFNFGFIINPDNFTKLIEGNYDRAFNKSPGKQQQPSGWLQACDELTR